MEPHRMTWTRPNRTEWLSFLIAMPFLSIMVNSILFGSQLLHNLSVWLISVPLVYAGGFVGWYVLILVMHWLRQRYPLVSQTVKRLGVLAVAHLGITTVGFLLLFHGYDALGILGFRFHQGNFIFALVMGLALIMMATALWESDYFFFQLKSTLKEKELLEQLHLQQEFNTLKSQVNPHFLFNCFNTLSSLISEDRKGAEAFLNELSHVYRYLLKNNQDGLSTLRTELRFIESYFRLLQTRHGASVQLRVEVDRKYEAYLLPSLSLQLLVENAVKHNILSRDQPLVIDIFTTAGNRLVVNNNLQRRNAQKFSNKVGLKNIEHKYQLLNQPGFHILEDEKNFCVVLPLIWSKSMDKTFIPTTTANTL
ncbi:sensor histidine kinase [Flaviaesturariibacter amylovorans]|uniref:Signal transduction histidine kinase internal region domain-containing protein n=1 Tax=Flaviaesturariibacter amylovorans TaxID=1084520 RepID=A0ABP8GJL6_9BACT